MTKKDQLFPAHHTIHLVRGSPGERCFYSISDYDFYLQQLQYFLTVFKVELHAYVLTKRRVHLLMTPSDDSGITLMMDQLEICYQQRMISRCYTKKPVWTDRYQWSLVQPQTFLLICSQYIENLPVALGLCEVAMEHPWSSYGHNAMGKDDSLISEHPEYKRLGLNADIRACRYDGISNQYNANRCSEIRYRQIRLSLKKNLPLGNRTFAKEIQQRFNNNGKSFFKGYLSLPGFFSGLLPQNAAPGKQIANK